MNATDGTAALPFVAAPSKSIPAELRTRRPTLEPRPPTEHRTPTAPYTPNTARTNSRLRAWFSTAVRVIFVPPSSANSTV